MLNKIIKGPIANQQDLGPSPFDDKSVLSAFLDTRAYSEHICEPLSVEDHSLQAAPFVSPPKWHLAHTTWFFETFILKIFVKDYRVFDSHYEVLFNSYYNGIGEQYPRPQRGLLSRPSLDTVLDYRKHVDSAMSQLLKDDSNKDREEIIARCVLGINHEQQHQELFFYDIKHSFSFNPLNPSYYNEPEIKQEESALQFINVKEGIYDIGEDLNTEYFIFDNESPKHKTYINEFSIANRLVTNKEYQDFIDDGGYQKADLWLADGWALIKEANWDKPLYWREHEGNKFEFGLYGLQKRHEHNAVSHISAYEADAYAKWADARLPTEQEWEVAARTVDCKLNQLFDQYWQWTASAYRPYPGFKELDGAIGEYNGKFMSNQWVLKGGSKVSSSGHLRASYRNFFYPQDRWQYSGIRLAKD